MTHRKYSPAHNFWHPRVEGQIKHTMGIHPEWFNVTPSNKKSMVNSLAKRIVGEIIAATKRGYNAGLSDDVLPKPGSAVNDGCRLSRRGVPRTPVFVAPLNFTWYDAARTLPEKGGTIPYFVVYKPKTHRQPKVTLAIWTGTTWKFILARYKSALPENVTHWAKYPEAPRKYAVTPPNADKHVESSKPQQPAELAGV